MPCPSSWLLSAELAGAMPWMALGLPHELLTLGINRALGSRDPVTFHSPPPKHTSNKEASFLLHNV